MLNSVKNQRRQFGVFFDTPFPSYNKAQNSCTTLSCTCSGSLYLFGSKSAQLSETELKFQEQYQNFYGNFIRHGNPNNWTDNPNQSSRLEGSGFGEIEQEALKFFHSRHTVAHRIFFFKFKSGTVIGMVFLLKSKECFDGLQIKPQN